MSLEDRYRGCLLGLACGDAVGTSVEFSPRGSLCPLTGMRGGGPFGLEPGEWTDDTSMALCLADSLLECGGFDAGDQMRRCLDWWRRGYRSSNGRCFDIGGTVRAALSRYERSGGEPWQGSEQPRSAGNGSIMRLAPAAMFLAPDVEAAAHHAAQIRGSGYVVESLEAALWCVAPGDGFEAAVLRAANLGDDADTTTAGCGQLAGAVYGASGIPEGWRSTLALAAEREALADGLRRAGPV